MCECRDVNDLPVKRVGLYVKKHKTKMNRGGYQRIGDICPICKETAIK